MHRGCLFQFCHDNLQYMNMTQLGQMSAMLNTFQLDIVDAPTIFSMEVRWLIVAFLISLLRTRLDAIRSRILNSSLMDQRHEPDFVGKNVSFGPTRPPLTLQLCNSWPHPKGNFLFYLFNYFGHWAKKNTSLFILHLHINYQRKIILLEYIFPPLFIHMSQFLNYTVENPENICFGGLVFNSFGNCH